MRSRYWYQRALLLFFSPFFLGIRNTGVLKQTNKKEISGLFGAGNELCAKNL